MTTFPLVSAPRYRQRSIIIAATIMIQGVIQMNAKDLEEALEMGMDWSLREGCAAGRGICT